MKVLFHPSFKKKLARSPDKIGTAFYAKLDIFVHEPFSPLLENHPLRGERRGQRSINITGDYRAVFEEQEDGAILFIEIGRHRDLYD